ncbi:MAG: glycosyltransferase family 4 protein [Parvularculaceae bacterium]|nr:glycosyltransferase family 4 protein [Parvularculaceae bacterium]
MGVEPCILYMSGTLPTRSETFVYREIFALRALGLPIRTASVHAPDRDLGDPQLARLAEETQSVYGPGAAALLRDAAFELLSHPRRAAATIGQGLLDALCSADVPLRRRPKVLFQCLAALALARRVRSWNVRHIHAHMAHVPATIAMYTARQLSVRFSFTGHANDLFPNRTLLREKLQRSAFTACISHWHRGFYRGILPRDDQHRPIVRCGVDTAALRPADRVDSATLRVLTVCRLVPKKGIDVLIEALARLPAEAPFECTIVGDGPQRAALEALVAARGQQQRTRFLGQRSNRDVLELMRQADLFVLPCRVAGSGDRDGIPVVLMEAMAAGLCVISGDLPAIRELVQHDETGLLVAPEDVSALSAALLQIAGDAALRARLRAAGRRRIEQEFDLGLNAGRIAQALQNACGLTPDAVGDPAGLMTDAGRSPRRASSGDDGVHHATNSVTGARVR